MKPIQSTELYPEVKSDEEPNAPPLTPQNIFPTFSNVQEPQGLYTQQACLNEQEYAPAETTSQYSDDPVQKSDELGSAPKTSRRKYLLIGGLGCGLCCLVLVILAIALPVSLTCLSGLPYHKQEQFSFDPPIVSIPVESMTFVIAGDGDVELIPTSGSTIIVEVDTSWRYYRNSITTFSSSGNTLTLETTGAGKACQKVVRKVYIPAAAETMNLEIYINSGDVYQGGEAGRSLKFNSVQIHSGSGDIRFSNLLALYEIIIESSSGDIKVETITSTQGAIKIKASSGDQSFGAMTASGNIALISNSGDLNARSMISSYGVTTKLSSGDQTIHSVQAPFINTSASSGNINLGVSYFQGSFVVNTNSGEARINNAGAKQITYTKNKEDRREGFVDSPTPTSVLNASTGSGDVLVTLL